MANGKKVKPISPPDFDNPVTIENIGLFIKAKRTSQGLNTEDCAMLCDVSAYTLNKIENGFKGVKLETILQITQALGIKLKVQKWEDE